MKKKDSIKNITNRHFYLLLLNIILISGFTLFIFIRLYSNANSEMEFNKTVSHINSIALALSNIDKDEDFNDIRILYRELIEDFSRLNPKLIRNIDWLVEAPSKTSAGETQYQFYITQIRDYASKIRKNRADIQISTGNTIRIIVVIILLITIVALINLLYWKKKQNQFLKEIKSGVDSVDNILKFNDTYLLSPEEACLLESRDFLLDVGKIVEDISFDRSLQDIDVYGNLDGVLKDLYFILNRKICCDRVALAFIGANGEITAETAYTEYNDLHLEPGYSEPITSTSLEELAKSKDVRIISDLEQYSSSKTAHTKQEPSESTKRIIQEGIKSSLTIPFYINQRCVGFLFISCKTKNAYDEAASLYAKRIFSQVKNKLYLKYTIQDIIAEIAHSFVTLMNEKDNETSSHIKRMSLYASIIAKNYARHHKNITPRFVREILWYAPLHDIGKIGIPDSILMKPGNLSVNEMEKMKEHVQIGVNVIQDINRNLSSYFSVPVMKTAIEIITGHHEKFNGTGYPKGLAGDEIPLAGRIVAAADVFDALSSRRPYKEAYSLKESLKIMNDEMKGHFDSSILACLASSMNEISEVYNLYKEI